MRRVLALSVLLLTSAFGCSEESNPNPVGTGGTGGSGGSGASGGGPSYLNNGPGTCANTWKPANDGFCQAGPVGSCAEPADCATNRPIDSCCVLIGEPGKAAGSPYLKRTTTTKEYSDPTGAPPNLSCFEPGSYPAKPPGGTPTMVKLTGIIKPFANGGCDPTGLTGTDPSQSDAVRMEVYTVKRTGDPATDGEADQLVGTPLVVNDAMPIELETVDNCSGDDRPNRVYEYPEVPMHTELLVKTYSTDNSWRPLYAYNVYISEDDPSFDSANQAYDYDVRALAADDFNTIPTVAIGKPIAPGNAALGGEVHDCDNIRLQYARVDISAPRAALVYFDNNEDNPLPDSNQSEIGTGSTALYSALDIKVDGDSSFVRVAGTGLVPDGNQSKLVSLGYFDARIYKGAVTSVTLRGLRPFQVP